MEITSGFVKWQCLSLRATWDRLQRQLLQLNRETLKKKFHCSFCFIVLFSLSLDHSQKSTLSSQEEKCNWLSQNVRYKEQTCVTPVSLKEKNARLAILRSRFFHVYCHCERVPCFWREAGVQTLCRFQDFWLLRRLALLSKSRGSSSPCKSSVSQTQLARGRAALAKLALLQDPKRNPQLLCQSSVNST